MVSDRRESFTENGVKVMKWGLAREAIGRDIQRAAFDHALPVCFRGTLDEGYRISYDHDRGVHDRENEPDHGELPQSVTHYWLPPVPARPDEGDGVVYLEDYQGNRKPTSFNVWADSKPAAEFPLHGFYRTWANRVTEAFAPGWDQVNKIPDERDFWEAANQVRDVIRPLESLNAPGESYYTACRALGLITHDPGAQGTTPPARMWAPQINGPIDNFVIPLQGAFLNLHVLGQLMAAQLDGMAKMWQNARASVMDIGWHGTQAMGDTKVGFDVKVVIKGAGWVVGAMGLVVLPEAAAIGVGVAGLVLAGAQELLDALEDKDVVDRESTLRGPTAQDVLNAVQSVLNADQDNSLEPQVQADESTVADILETAQTTIDTKNSIFDPGTGTYRTYFTVAVSDIMADARNDKPQADIELDVQRLREAGKSFADELAGELRRIGQETRGLCSTATAWERPIVGIQSIGMGPEGPWKNWTSTRDKMAEILDTTATQVEDVGEYFIATANYLERQDQTAKEAFDQASKTLKDAFN